jgi:hypothetical protein
MLQKNSLDPPLCIEMPVPRQEGEW